MTLPVNQATENVLCLRIANLTKQLQQFSIFWRKSSNIIYKFTILLPKINVHVEKRGFITISLDMHRITTITSTSHTHTKNEAAFQHKF